MTPKLHQNDGESHEYSQSRRRRETTALNNTEPGLPTVDSACAQLQLGMAENHG